MCTLLKPDHHLQCCDYANKDISQRVSTSSFEFCKCAKGARTSRKRVFLFPNRFAFFCFAFINRAAIRLKFYPQKSAEILPSKHVFRSPAGKWPRFFCFKTTPEKHPEGFNIHVCIRFRFFLKGGGEVRRSYHHQPTWPRISLCK